MRHRTIFPPNVDFAGWWIKSPNGLIAQLIRDSRDRHDAILYHLRYNDEQVGDGNGRWTAEKLTETRCVVRRTREEVENGKQEAIPVKPDRPAERPQRRILRRG